MANEVDEELKRLGNYKGVIGVIVVNSEGIPIKTSMDNATSIAYAGLVSNLADKARNVIKDLDPTNELVFLRLRSTKYEIMIAPDREFILIVVQIPVD